ncbi:MAG: FAA hydrolase family protein [Candidatus Latescibacterota bacterium]|nr:MAG: FAA hydrolase family protein [Candidatus Latescibacterota bacterium]
MRARIPGEPVLFLKPTTALVRPDGGELFVPESYGLLHHEIELVALLGRGGKNLSEEETAGRIAGYAVALDLTLREPQTAAKKAGEPWMLWKGFDGSCPVGAFAPAERVPDPCALALSLEVNGEVRQKGHTSSMMFSPARIVAYASRYITLEEGDLFLCGTPDGVGPLVHGDKIAARIDGLPEMRFELKR